VTAAVMKLVDDAVFRGFSEMRFDKRHDPPWDVPVIYGMDIGVLTLILHRHRPWLANPRVLHGYLGDEP